MRKVLAYSLLLVGMASCKKFTEIDPPKDFLSSTEAFATDITANATIVNIYNNLTTSALVNLNANLLMGLSADELERINPSQDQTAFQQNNLSVNSANVASLWNAAYIVISQANVAIQGVNASTGITAEKKKQFIGEAKFLRAYCYFYLVNLYGDLPLVLDPAWQNNTRISRTAASKVYEQIIQDLTDAQTLLPESYSSGQYIRSTRWAATAMLSRVYLYNKRWAEAAAQATDIIENSGLYNGSLPAPADVFLIQSTEAIWQLQPASYLKNPIESNLIAGFGSVYYSLSDDLINAFEPGDLRKTAWVAGTGTLYPAKYKGDPYSGATTEGYMMLRMGEQFLIRAEALAMQNNVSDAVSDLNVIRERAGLDGLSATLSQAACIAAVEQERRVELMAEWGHRWLDLKRLPAVSGAAGKVRADEVLSLVKGVNWQSTDVLYPVPAADVKLNPNLNPNNPGY